MNRRGLLAAVVVVGASSSAAAPFSLPDLPYTYDALEPVISERTLMTHHLKHHAKYVDTANKLIGQDATLSTATYPEIIATRQEDAVLFNNVAQSWNHDFYWKCMKPGGGGPPPPGALADAIDGRFGSFDAFASEMEKAALTAFGSGWAWLGYDPGTGGLVVTKTTGAGNPMTEGIVPILTIDVWEHAYYLDYQEKRPAYVKAFFDKLVNWEFVEGNFRAAKAGAGGVGEEL